MSKEETQEALQDAFAEFAAEYPQSALALITGLFVGLLEYSVEKAGGDPKQEIKIDGCGKRDITVSAVPNAPHEGPGAASSRTVPLDAVVGPREAEK